MKRHTRATGGYSLIELTIYIGILAALAVMAVGGMISMVRTFGEIRAYTDLRQGGASALDRMTREIRYASAVDMAGTTLDANPGRLKLTSTDESGTPKTMEFSVASESLVLAENGVDTGSIVGDGVTVESFVVRRALTDKGALVKLELMLKDTRDAGARSAAFYGSAVLRGAY